MSILECAAESWRVEGFDVHTFEGVDGQGVIVALSTNFGHFIEVVNVRGESTVAAMSEVGMFSLGVCLVKEL